MPDNAPNTPEKKPTPDKQPDREIRYNDENHVDLPGLISDDSDDMRPLQELTDEFSQRNVLSDDFGGHRGIADEYRRQGHKSRERDFMRSRQTNPEQEQEDEDNPPPAQA